MAENEADKMKGWIEQWEKNDIGWHLSSVHKHLQKHKSLLFEEGESKKFFIPLCGKTMDMKWLSDHGHTVVGVDGAIKCLKDFCGEQGLEYTQEKASNMGPECEVLKINGRELNLYLGDIFLFNKSIEGQFDCIWDRGALVAVDRSDAKEYAALMKDLLKPGGKIFLEVYEYEIAIFDDTPGFPPPFPLFEDELKSLYGQDCSIELVERSQRNIMGKNVDMLFYLIVKK